MHYSHFYNDIALAEAFSIVILLICVVQSDRDVGIIGRQIQIY